MANSIWIRRVIILIMGLVVGLVSYLLRSHYLFSPLREPDRALAYLAFFFIISEWTWGNTHLHGFTYYLYPQAGQKKWDNDIYDGAEAKIAGGFLGWFMRVGYWGSLAVMLFLLVQLFSGGFYQGNQVERIEQSNRAVSENITQLIQSNQELNQTLRALVSENVTLKK